MVNWRRFAPAAPARVHLALAASMWVAVGCGLVAFGVGAALHLGGSPARATTMVAVGVVAGVAKARWVLGRTARRISARIVERGDGRCLGGFLSPGSWALVLAMMVGGRFLRSSHALPMVLVAILYVAVGTGLLIGSADLWRSWRSQRSDAPGSAAGRVASLDSHPSQRNR